MVGVSVLVDVVFGAGVGVVGAAVLVVVVLGVVEVEVVGVVVGVVVAGVVVVVVSVLVVVSGVLVVVEVDVVGTVVLLPSVGVSVLGGVCTSFVPSGMDVTASAAVFPELSSAGKAFAVNSATNATSSTALAYFAETILPGLVFFGRYLNSTTHSF